YALAPAHLAVYNLIRYIIEENRVRNKECFHRARAHMDVKNIRDAWLSKTIYTYS
ncbi:hypothetical protein ACJX0J_026821, partial [Zea mays]